jgi:hypothetical protein
VLEFGAAQQARDLLGDGVTPVAELRELRGALLIDGVAWVSGGERAR